MGVEARKYAVIHLNRDDILTSFELSLMKACSHTSLPVQQGPSEGPSRHRATMPDLTRKTGVPDHFRSEGVAVPNEP
jgi:hypothetical protein